MLIIAFHNERGGVGSTMLTAHMCEVACDVGLKVVAVSVDPHADLLRWRHGSLTNAIDRDPKRAIDADLVVMDVRAYAEPPFGPEVWVVPISDRRASAAETPGAHRFPPPSHRRRTSRARVT